MILDILGSAGFGTIIGGVFGFLGKREERKLLAEKNSHALNMVKARTEAALQVAKMGIEEAKVAGQLAVEKADVQAFVESQKARSPVSETVKSFVRPVILGLLMFQTYRILSSLEALTGGLQTVPAVELIGLYKTVILAVTGLTATAVGWYFATRSSKQFDRLLDREMGAAKPGAVKGGG